jgi:hypothetical protein
MPACRSLARIGTQRAGFPLRAGLTKYFMRHPVMRFMTHRTTHRITHGTTPLRQRA